jgi:hypothetical protein
MLPLIKGSQGSAVKQLQQSLCDRGLTVEVDGEFGPETYKAVRAFQAQNLDQHGQPLVIDGSVGPLTWWSLTHPKPAIVTPSAVDFTQMPPAELDGSALGRQALKCAISELVSGAGEIGGNNMGLWVRKYLAPAGLEEGEPWCASFVSWCFLQASGGNKAAMPFNYTPGAQDLLKQMKDKGWSYKPESAYQPQPGDLVFWWREKSSSWQGHVGLVHQLKEGMLYTIEGNKSPNVQGFSYVFSRMDRLLGFGHIA